MADITDIKAILYTEKTIELQGDNMVVVKTSTNMTKNKLKDVFREYFGVKIVRVNSLRQQGKKKMFKGKVGTRASFKKFYVTLPQGAQITSVSV